MIGTTEPSVFIFSKILDFAEETVSGVVSVCFQVYFCFVIVSNSEIPLKQRAKKIIYRIKNSSAFFSKKEVEIFKILNFSAFRGFGNFDTFEFFNKFSNVQKSCIFGIFRNKIKLIIHDFWKSFQKFCIFKLFEISEHF